MTRFNKNYKAIARDLVAQLSGNSLTVEEVSIVLNMAKQAYSRAAMESTPELPKILEYIPLPQCTNEDTPEYGGKNDCISTKQ